MLFASLVQTALANPGELLLLLVMGLLLLYVARRYSARAAHDVSADRVTADEVPPFRDDEVQHDEIQDFEAEKEQIPFSMTRYSEEETRSRSGAFYRLMNTRRTCRMFSTDAVPRDVIENLIRTAGTAPSGAHTEPWTFLAVREPSLKKRLREIVEEEEYFNYKRRMGDMWVKDLKPIHVSWTKPYIEDAAWIVIVFRQAHGVTSDGQKKTHYYSEVSVSLSVGFLLAAITNAGLVTVTHTPLNVGPQLRQLFSRPANEKFAMLLPVGYPAEDAKVPDLQRKPLQDYLHVFD